MKEQLISFDTAKLAKELGFDVPIQHTVNKVNQLYDIHNNKININSNIVTNWNKFNTVISAPTQSLLQKWLRDKYGLHVEVRLANQVKKKSYYYGVFEYFVYRHQLVQSNSRFKKYEESLEVGLQEALNLIKNKK